MLNHPGPRKPASTTGSSYVEEGSTDRISPLSCSLSEPSIASTVTRLLRKVVPATQKSVGYL